MADNKAVKETKVIKCGKCGADIDHTTLKTCPECKGAICRVCGQCKCG